MKWPGGSLPKKQRINAGREQPTQDRRSRPPPDGPRIADKARRVGYHRLDAATILARIGSPGCPMAVAIAGHRAWRIGRATRHGRLDQAITPAAACRPRRASASAPPDDPRRRPALPPLAARLVAPEAAPRRPSSLGTPLMPGQVIQPIDLAGALRLAGARDLDIAIARERVCQAMAELEQARSSGCRASTSGPNWIRHDGQAQVVEGPVRTISKSSLFLGATAAAARASAARSRPGARRRSRA